MCKCYVKIDFVLAALVIFALIVTGIVFCSIGIKQHNDSLVTVPVSIYNSSIVDRYQTEDPLIIDDEDIKCGKGIRERTVILLKVYCRYQNQSENHYSDYRIIYCSQIGDEDILRLAKGSLKDRTPCYFDSRDGTLTTKNAVGYIIGLVFLSLLLIVSIVFGIKFY